MLPICQSRWHYYNFRLESTSVPSFNQLLLIDLFLVCSAIHGGSSWSAFALPCTLLLFYDCLMIWPSLQQPPSLWQWCRNSNHSQQVHVRYVQFHSRPNSCRLLGIGFAANAKTDWVSWESVSKSAMWTGPCGWSPSQLNCGLDWSMFNLPEWAEKDLRDCWWSKI